MRLTAPGNLLLLGEYAVVEAGGLGIAMAAGPRLTVSVGAGRELTVTGTWGEHTVIWPGPGSELLGAVIAQFPAPGSADVRVDSASFFAAGDKRGFGSSAAVAVGLTAALRAAAGLPADREGVFATALRAHREFQGGRGSGYDVAASTYGGIGLFRGGSEPRWTALELPWLPPFGVVAAGGPVRTPGAIARYRRWKDEQPEAAAAFLERSNGAVAEFAGAGGWTSACRAFERCRELGLELGEAIGVSAEVSFPPGTVGKAVGAGAELAVVVDVAGLEPLMLQQGLEWDP